MSACHACLQRSWLLRELAGHLDLVRADVTALLALGNHELIAAVGGRRREELVSRLGEYDPLDGRSQAELSGLDLICRCDDAYPEALRDLAATPAVLHVVGGARRFTGLAGSQSVAIVGTRRASSYGISVARSLARGLAVAGVPVVSGMANGIDAAAHEGALSVAGPTVAVLPGPANDVYPRGASGLYRRLLEVGAVVSELPPMASIRSWMFLARNRIIAGLAAMTVVVEADEGSGALLTAGCAAGLGRLVGAVPGRVTARHAAGPNRLLSGGAHVITHAQDVLDLLFEAGTRRAPADDRPELTAELRAVLEAIESGHDTPAALVRRGIAAEPPLAALASLELAGYVQRGAGGRFTVVP